MTTTQTDDVRRCNCCGSVMWQGYVIDGGAAYYCTDTCLHTVMTEAEYMELYADGDGDSYWTEWEPDNNEEWLESYVGSEAEDYE